MIAHFKVFWAVITNNWSGKQMDVHGRTYTDVWMKHGHMAMVREYRETNSWRIK